MEYHKAVGFSIYVYVNITNYVINSEFLLVLILLPIKVKIVPEGAKYFRSVSVEKISLFW